MAGFQGLRVKADAKRRANLDSALRIVPMEGRLMGRKLYGIRITTIAFFTAALFIASGTTNAKPAQDAQAFITQAQELLAAGNGASLKALGVGTETLAWYDEQKRRAKWKLALLPIPGNAKADPLAVFYDFHTCESIGDHIHRLVKTPEGWRFGPEIPETDTQGYRVRDHSLDVKYDLAKSVAIIVDSVSIERLPGASDVCLLRLSSDFKLESHNYPNDRKLPLTHAPGVIALLAPPNEKRFQVTLHYQGLVNHPHSDFVLPSESVLVSYWYPHIARLPAKHGVSVTVPKGWTAIGQGELRGKQEKGEEVTFRYRNEIATCYFTLDAGPYKVTTREVNGRKYSLCELKSVPGRIEKSFADLIGSLEFFEKSFGKYPYTHYEIVETLQPFGGALEAYSFATFQSGTIPGAIVHEVAHTWWGGVVPNPYTRTMWNESFASYCDGLYRRQSAPSSRSISTAQPPTSSSAGRRAVEGMHLDPQKGRGMIQAFRVPMSQSTDTSDPGHGSVGYGKGALVLGMLEDLLGTEKMIACMRRFYQDHKAGDPADWPDFERAVKNVTGRDYGWFFRQWVERGGVPQVRLAEVTVTPQNGAYLVRGRVLQEGAPYQMRIPIALETTGERILKELDVDGPSTTFEIMSPTAVKSVKLDPAGNIVMAGAIGGDEKTDPFVVTL